MFKKIAIFTTIISIAFIGISNVNADEVDDNYNEEITIEINENGIGAPSEFFSNPSDILVNNLFRSTSKPTVYWNLANSSYTANLQEIRASLVYTNYYFSPNSSGKINLDYNIRGIETNGTQMRISVYNKSTDRIVSEYITAGVPTGQCMTFSGLNTN